MTMPIRTRDLAATRAARHVAPIRDAEHLDLWAPVNAATLRADRGARLRPVIRGLRAFVVTAVLALAAVAGLLA